VHSRWLKGVWFCDHEARPKPGRLGRDTTSLDAKNPAWRWTQAYQRTALGGRPRSNVKEPVVQRCPRRSPGERRHRDERVSTRAHEHENSIILESTPAEAARGLSRSVCSAARAVVVLRGRTAAIMRIWRTGDIALRTALNRTKLSLCTRSGLLWCWSKFGGRPWSGSIFFQRLKAELSSLL